MNESCFSSIEPMETTQACFKHLLWQNPLGEAQKDALRLDFTVDLSFKSTEPDWTVVILGNCEVFSTFSGELL